MGSAILRWISRKGVAKCWISRKGTAGIVSSARSSHCCGSKGARISGVSVSDESVTLPSRISPWLMLPPAFEGGDMVYKFYSLAENKVLSLNKRGGAGGGGEEELELPDDESKFVGSSHGWLVLFNQRNCDLFLSNPLSRRHIKLPPIRTLPIPEANLRRGYGCVSKVIISCPPDDEECRAMMTFGPGARLAFCLPGRSTEWTPIGDLFHEYEDGKFARRYENFVYSSRQKLLFCITGREVDLEAWDLGDPLSPRIDWMDEDKLVFDEENYPWAARSEEESKLKELCHRLQYLVFAEQSNELFLVTRHINPRMGSDGSFVKNISYGQRRGWDDSYPYKTIDFDVHKIDLKAEKLRYMEGYLDGLVMFIGNNHSFAMSASEFPELKSNSIYFTDENYSIPPPDWMCSTYVGHDIGIFNYENRTFSPCYYPCDYQKIKRIVPPPMWFTPCPH